MSDATYAIYEPHQAEEVISYLILGNARAVLFDTGMGIGNMAAVVHALTSLPVAVINSHTHNDHVGDNWQFTDVLDRDLPFARQNAKGSRADAQAELAPDQLCGELPAHFGRQAYRTKPWRITGFVRDGEQIDLGGRTLQVIATPGHTPDSVSLFDRAHGLLFTGDTVYPGEIYLYRPETDLAAYAASLRKLIALTPEIHTLLPAHNVPMASPVLLGRVLDAFMQVRGGAVQPVRRGDNDVYLFPEFSFRMKAR